MSEMIWQLAHKNEAVYVFSNEILWLKSGPNGMKCILDNIEVGVRLEALNINQYGYIWRTAKVAKIFEINNDKDCIMIHFKTKANEYKLFYAPVEYFESQAHDVKLMNFFEEYE